MGSTIWFNVVIVDSTQINLLIQVIISRRTITRIVAQAKDELCHNWHPHRCVFSSCHNKIFECLHQHACIHTISFLHQFCNIQNHHHLHSILFMQPFRVGFRTWILHPSQQRCGGIPPSPPGLRNVGLRPRCPLSPRPPPGGEFPRERRRRGARVHGALAWSLLLCFAARIRWRQGERRDTNERITGCKAK